MYGAFMLLLGTVVAIGSAFLVASVGWPFLVGSFAGGALMGHGLARLR